MNETILNRTGMETLESIETQILTHHQQALQHHHQTLNHAQSAVENILAAGRLLIEAKAQKHKTFKKWLQQLCDQEKSATSGAFSFRTAQRYMQVARFSNKQQLQTFTTPKQLYLATGITQKKKPKTTPPSIPENPFTLHFQHTPTDQWSPQQIHRFLTHAKPIVQLYMLLSRF
jgi:hypothetical protein